MCHRHAQKCSFVAAVRERRIIYLNASRNHVTNKSESAVSYQRTRQKTGFAQNLKPVARPEHELTGARVADYCLHDRRKTSDGPTAKVIAIRKAARQHDSVEVI